MLQDAAVRLVCVWVNLSPVIRSCSNGNPCLSAKSRKIIVRRWHGHSRIGLNLVREWHERVGKFVSGMANRE